jgi:hypothetical protein
MGPTDVAEGRRIDEASDRRQGVLEDAALTRMEEQRSLIADEELIKGEPRLLVVARDPEDPIGDLVDFGHAILRSSCLIRLDARQGGRAVRPSYV